MLNPFRLLPFITFRLLPFIVLSVMLFADWSFATNEPKQTLRIGLIAPLTLGNAAMGEDIRRAVELVVKQFNVNDNSRYRYELIAEDGKCGSSNAASSAASKLINLDKVHGLVVGCSGEILQSAQLIELRRIPTVVVYSSHPKVKELGPHIFRVFIDAEKDIPVIGEKILRDGRSRVAILTEELPFTVAIRDVLQQQLGKKVVMTSDFKEGEQDFRTLLLRVRATRPDALFLNAGAVETLGPLVKQAAELQLQLPLYSFAYAAADAFLDNYGSVADGLVYVGPPDFRGDSEEGKKLLNEFKAAFGEEPNVPFVAATAHDGAVALLTALDASGGNVETVLQKLNDYNAQGVLGEIRFDANGDIEKLHYVVKMISDGKIIAAD